MTQPVLVTGGTGFLGRWLVRHLLDEGETVRILARRERPEMADPNLTFVPGSILDENVCARALDGVGAVYHLAGFVSHDPADRERMFEVHVEGTRTLLRAAEAAGCPKTVLVSTSGTVGVSKDPHRKATDDDPYALGIAAEWPYYLSKIYQEQTATRMATDAGIELVIVRPSLLLGPGDRDLSSTKEIKDFLDRRIPVVLSGGLSFVDVRDVAKTLPAAMSLGRAGESYLLGARNMMIAEFMEALESVSGVPAPKLTLPDVVTRTAARFLRGVGDLLDLSPVGLDPMVIEMGQHFWYIDSGKAKRELGFEPRRIDQTLLDTVRYIRHELPGERREQPGTAEEASRGFDEADSLAELLARHSATPLKRARNVLRDVFSD